MIQTPLGPAGPAAALRRLSEGSGGKTPTVKNFTPEWVRSLQERGVPNVYTHGNSADFRYIGMPVGGTGTGPVYQGGDGKTADGWGDVHAEASPRVAEAHAHAAVRSAAPAVVRLRREYGCALHVTVVVAGRPVPASSRVQDRRLTVTLGTDAHLAAGRSLEVTVA